MQGCGIGRLDIMRPKQCCKFQGEGTNIQNGYGPLFMKAVWNYDTRSTPCTIA